MSVVKSAGQPFVMVFAGATSNRNCVGGIDIDAASHLFSEIEIGANISWRYFFARISKMLNRCKVAIALIGGI